MASRILHFAKTRPLAFGMGFSLVKTSGADLMVQKVLEQRETIDWKRNIAFGSFGLFYLGGVQYVLYVPIFSRLFPRAASFAAKSVADKVKDMPGIRGLFAQVFLDQAVHHPLMYFPIFYCVKGEPPRAARHASAPPHAGPRLPPRPRARSPADRGRRAAQTS